MVLKYENDFKISELYRSRTFQKVEKLGDILKILNKVKYIITETSIESTYKGGASFVELEKYLSKFNYKYICSNKFNNSYPNLNLKGYSEFDTLFIKQ